jgi:hypothetical protein
VELQNLAEHARTCRCSYARQVRGMAVRGRERNGWTTFFPDAPFSAFPADDD